MVSLDALDESCSIQPEPTEKSSTKLPPRTTPSTLTPALAQAVQSDRQDDHRADDDFLRKRLPAHLIRSIAQHGHDQRADHRAENAAGAAAQTRAAYHHC